MTKISTLISQKLVQDFVDMQPADIYEVVSYSEITNPPNNFGEVDDTKNIDSYD